jgi:hypothetical protein
MVHPQIDRKVTGALEIAGQMPRKQGWFVLRFLKNDEAGLAFGISSPLALTCYLASLKPFVMPFSTILVPVYFTP